MWHDDDIPRDIRAYHRRTKHAPTRYALGPAFLAWEDQPDPFRSFEDAPRFALPLGYERETPIFSQLGNTPADPLSAQSLGLFLELALGLSAWKQAGDTTWSLRNNPSSGNLHPTEGWIVLPPVDGLAAAPSVYHYSPFHHALEQRCRLQALPNWPHGAFLMGVSSVHWREEWKYGERAFRYCQHDVGHALGALAYGAACLGWAIRALPHPSDDQVAALLGLDRDDASHRYEEEHPDLLVIVSPNGVSELALPVLDGAQWSGRANVLSGDHDAWPAVRAATRFCLKPETPPITAQPPAPQTAPLAAPTHDRPAAEVIRSRRSAMRMDGRTGLSRAAFLRMMEAAMPTQALPFQALPWGPRLSLFMFVHRVEGLKPGLYALIRQPDALARLQAACDPEFLWHDIEPGLPLMLLQEGPYDKVATKLSCVQTIAGQGAFSLGMVADFAKTLAEDGDWAYRRLHWEAGMIGQALYLEAVVAGLSATGIGCFFDDSVHAALGIDGDALEWQSLYHFTIGGAVEDSRLATLPAYFHRAP